MKTNENRLTEVKSQAAGTMEAQGSLGSARKSFIKEWGPRAALIVFAAIWLALMAASWAQAATPPASDDEYNFNWLDPEKKIYVLQNRKFTKANRLLLTAMAGTSSASAYRSTINFDPRVAYYLSEAIGIEAFYTISSNTENSVYKALLSATGSTTLPVIREVRSQKGLLLHWVPWYAKINVFNNILYFDWYVAGGAGVSGTALEHRANASATPTFSNEDLTTFYWGTGHQYHLNRYLTIRLDVTGAYYNAPIFGDTGDKTWFSNYNFGLGLGLRI